MALDPLVLAQPVEQPVLVAQPVLEEPVSDLQKAYQARRLQATERERWAILDRVSHQAYQVLARCLELEERLAQRVASQEPAAPVFLPAPPPVGAPQSAPDPEAPAEALPEALLETALGRDRVSGGLAHPV